ncbi:MAG: hypothetical protein ABJA57_07000 [Ginsengibacter sp.]
MNDDAGTIGNSILEDLTRTLLYEGYSLYPYHRASVKNRKPIPFGVLFPGDYHVANSHAQSQMQAECLVTGHGSFSVNISLRFLHLQIIVRHDEGTSIDHLIAAAHSRANCQSFQDGWRTIERRISTGNIRIEELLTGLTKIPIAFDEYVEIENDPGNDDQQQHAVMNAAICGTVTVKATRIENTSDAFLISVSVTNTTPVENINVKTRDDVLLQSFLSTHMVLETVNAKFISHQNPGEEWQSLIDQCKNKNTWPVLIDEKDTILLSSPIILYDHPKIHPQSSGDLFDSTEIEEALLLHVGMLSEDEKKTIGESDEKLRAMLEKVSQVTPEEMVRFHSGLQNVQP